MKLNLDKFTVEGFSIETEGNGSSKGWIAATIIISLSIIITVCIAVKITVDYTFSNRPAIEQKANPQSSIEK